MDARLASRRFYLARAPTLSYKSMLPSPSTLLLPSSLFPQHRTSSLLDAWTTSVRHFLSPWQLCNRYTARLPPISLPLYINGDDAALYPLVVPIRAFSLAFSEFYLVFVYPTLLVFSIAE